MVAARSDSLAVLLGRIFWALVGPVLLAVYAAMILSSPGRGWLTAADAGYLLVLGGMILGRYIEHRGGNPRNSMGEPSAPGDLRRYVQITLSAGLSLWVAANMISNYLLTRLAAG